MSKAREIETFHISTFGCQMNLADSSILVSTLITRGYRRVKSEADADLIIFNTCSVRDKAEQRVFGRLGDIARYKREKPYMKIAVVGCMAQRLGAELSEKVPHVDYVLGTDRLFELPDVLEGVEGTESVMTAFGHENLDIIEPIQQNDYSGFVTISRGCNNMCTYCIVPYVRGGEVSHSTDHIIKAVNQMVDKGVTEVTLLGQNVNSYQYGENDFPTLLRKLLRDSDIPRLRFMTSHPKDLSDNLIDVMASESRLMPHIHLPLQSGSDRVLQKMARVYTLKHYLGIINRIREALPYVSITTDLIVGFPSETEAEYMMTLEVVREIQYDAAFMFRYSVRPGTEACKYEDDVPENVKIKHLKKLIEIQKEISFQRNQREIGRISQCLVEGESRRSKDFMRARTEGNKIVLFKGNDYKKGEIVLVEITSADAYTLHGRLTVVN